MSSSFSSLQSAIGWMLVHDAWALSVIAVLFGLAHSLIPERRADLRYRSLVTGLLCMAGCSAFVFVSLIRATPDGTGTPRGFVSAAPAAHQWIAAISWAWALGALFLLVRYAIGACEVRSLRRSCRIVESGPWVDFVRRVEGEYSRVRKVSIAISRRAKGPMLIGILRPIIVLPSALLSSIPPAQIEMILRHELAHAYRLDNLVLPLQRVVEALLFFHPAVWWISRRISLEREACCDQRALAGGARPDQYVEALLSAARPSSYVTVQASMANDHVLSRVHRVLLKKDLPMTPSKRALMIFALCLPLLSGLGFSATSGESEKAKKAPAPVKSLSHHMFSGAKCSDCHVTTAPAASPPTTQVAASFNHEIHARGLACTQCHATSSKAQEETTAASLPQWTSPKTKKEEAGGVTTFSHKAVAGQDCKSCHTVAKPAPKPTLPLEKFVHPGLPGADLSGSKCSDCHTVPSHQEHTSPKKTPKQRKWVKPVHLRAWVSPKYGDVASSGRARR